MPKRKKNSSSESTTSSKRKKKNSSESIPPSIGDQSNVASSPAQSDEPNKEVLTHVDTTDLFPLLPDDFEPPALFAQEPLEESNKNPTPSLELDFTPRSLNFTPNTNADLLRSITTPSNNTEETHQQDNADQIARKKKKNEINKKSRDQLRKLDQTKVANDHPLHEHLNVTQMKRDWDNLARRLKINNISDFLEKPLKITSGNVINTWRGKLRKLDRTKVGENHCLYQYLHEIQTKGWWDNLSRRLKINSIGEFLEKEPVTQSNQSIDAEKETELTFTPNATLGTLPELPFISKTNDALLQSITIPNSDTEETHQQDNTNEIDIRKRINETKKAYNEKKKAYKAQPKKLDRKKIGEGLGEKHELNKYLVMNKKLSWWQHLGRKLQVKKIGQFLEETPVTQTNQSIDTEKETDLTFTPNAHALLFPLQDTPNSTSESFPELTLTPNAPLETLPELPITSNTTIDEQTSRKVQEQETNNSIPTHLGTNPAALFNSTNSSKKRKRVKSIPLNTTTQNSNNNSIPVLPNTLPKETQTPEQNPIQQVNTSKFSCYSERYEHYIVNQDFDVIVDGNTLSFKKDTSKTVGTWVQIIPATIFKGIVDKYFEKDPAYPTTELILQRNNIRTKNETKRKTKELVTLKASLISKDHPLHPFVGQTKSRHNWYRLNIILPDGERLFKFFVPVTSLEKTEIADIEPIAQNINCNDKEESSLFNTQNSRDLVGNFTEWGDFLKQIICSTLYIFENSYHIETIFEDETDVQIFLPDLDLHNITDCLTHVHSNFSNSSYKVAAVICHNSMFFMLFANFKNGSLTIDIANSYHDENYPEILKNITESELASSAQIRAFDLSEFIHENDHIPVSMMLASYFFSNSFIEFNRPKINDLCTHDEIEKLNNQFKQFLSDSEKQQIESLQTNVVGVTSSRDDKVGVTIDDNPTKKRKRNTSNTLNTTTQNTNNNSTTIQPYPIQKAHSFTLFPGNPQPAPTLLNNVPTNSQAMPNASSKETQAPESFSLKNLDHLENVSIYDPWDEFKEWEEDNNNNLLQDQEPSKQFPS